MPSRGKIKQKPLRWISTIALFSRVHAGQFLRALIKVKAMYESSRVNIQVEPFSTFTFTRDSLYIASILFTRVHTYNFPDIRNYPFIGFESPSYELRFGTLTMFPLIFFRASALESFFVMIIFHTRSSIVTRLCLAFWYPFCKWSECSNKAFKNVMEKSLI